MGRLLEPLLLRRQRSGACASTIAQGAQGVEVSLPMPLVPQQRECYRLSLARFYEVLADPRPPRHQGHRAAQLRTVCGELRKVSRACQETCPLTCRQRTSVL